MKKVIFVMLLSFITTPLLAQEDLNALNTFADKIYEKKIKSEKLPSVVIASPNRFIALYRDGKIDKRDVIPTKGIWLKDVGHLSLALFVLLSPFDEPHIDKQRMQELINLITAAQKDLQTLDFSPEQMKHQQKILALSKNIIEKTLKEGKLSPAYYQKFFAELRPLINANTETDMFYELNQVCSQMHAWRRQMSTDEWQKLKVLVIGNQIEHNNSVYIKFFTKLLHTKLSYDRLLVLHGIETIEAALQSLREIKTNILLGEVVFEDPNSVLQDVYGPFWNNYLEKTKITPQGCFAR